MSCSPVESQVKAEVKVSWRNISPSAGASIPE